MSPKAVKERLQTMNELWLLSVKLMNSKKIRNADERKVDLPDLDDNPDNEKNENRLNF